MTLNFDAIYHEHKGLVFNLALNYVQNTQDAEEITQDVFVSAYKALASFRKESKVSTWLYRITINKSLDLIKKRKRKKRFGFVTSLFFDNTNDIKFDQPSFDHPGVQLEHKEAIENIFKHINTLPPNQKTALILSKLEGKSQAEISVIMETSVKAVDALVQRAKKGLSKRLNNNR